MTVDEMLAQAREAYVARNPGSRERFEQACAALPGGNTRSVLYYEPFPLAVARGQGSRLWDVDGHEYADFLGEYTAGIYGHSHPVIRAALDAALDGGINLSGHNLLEPELAGLITQRIPSMQRVRFTNSGTEANLLAIALAKAYTGRGKVLVFRGGYHGGVLTFARGASPVNVPHAFLYARFNDLGSVRDALEGCASDLAAILVEPMQGAAGCIPGTSDFLLGLREEASRAGALLIFDEVMTSRLAPSGLQGKLGIVPDLTTVGKYIGGGMSFGAFGGREDIMRLFDPRRPDALPHAGTFNNNVLTMAAGIAGLSRVYTPHAALELNRHGDSLRSRLNDLCLARGAHVRFSGLGSLMNMHPCAVPVRSADDLGAADARLRDLFFFHMIAHGFYVARRGLVVLSLPLNQQDFDGFVQAFDGFLGRYGSVLGD